MRPRERLEELHKSVEGSKHLTYNYVPQRWITAEEGGLIAEICEENQIDVFVESGTASGYASCWAALVCKEVHTFDPVDRIKVYDNEEFGLAELKSKIRYYKAGFIPKGAEVAAKLEGNVVYFLDGARGTQGRQKDWGSIKHLVKEGDIVINHDAKERGISKCCKRAAKECNGAMRDYDTGYGLIAVHVGKGDGEF